MSFDYLHPSNTKDVPLVKLGRRLKLL